MRTLHWDLVGGTLTIIIIEFDAVRRAPADLALYLATVTFPLRARYAASAWDGHLAKGDIAAAYRAASHSLPDARIFVEPRITVESIHSTPNATANATVELIDAALAADGRAVHGQVQLMREVFDIEGVCGFPIVLNRDGWKLKAVDDLTRASRQLIIESAKSVRSFNTKLLHSKGHCGRNSNRMRAARFPE
jgi:hypothetical protein